MHLTAQDKGGEISGHAGERVIGVDSAPILERGTIVEVGEGSGGRSTRRRVKPGAVPTVEVL